MRKFMRINFGKRVTNQIVDNFSREGNLRKFKIFKRKKSKQTNQFFVPLSLANFRGLGKQGYQCQGKKDLHRSLQTQRRSLLLLSVRFKRTIR
jgi:hypothetical protein